MFSATVALCLVAMPALLFLLAYTGTLIYRRYRDARLEQSCDDSDDQKEDPKLPEGAHIEFVGTQEPAADPEECSPCRRLGYNEVMKQWKKLYETEIKNVPICEDAAGYRGKYLEPTAAAQAHNRAHVKLEGWLKGSSVTHPTGRQVCDVLAMIGTKEVPEPKPLPAAHFNNLFEQAAANSALNPERVTVGGMTSSVAEFTARTYNDLMNRAVDAVTRRATASVENAIEASLTNRILNKVEDKVKAVVRELLKETLQAAADKAMAAAQAAENFSKEDEAFYQKTVEESKEQMDMLRAQEEAQVKFGKMFKRVKIREKIAAKSKKRKKSKKK